MSGERIGQTVGGVLTTILPKGSTILTYRTAKLPASMIEDPRSPWLLAPTLVTDLFAATGYLCKLGGVVGFFDPNPYSSNDEVGSFSFNRKERDLLDDAAWYWRGGKRGGNARHPRRNNHAKTPVQPPYLVRKLWSVLLDYWDSPVNCGFYIHTDRTETPPTWWRAALSLMLVADMAAVRPFRDQLSGFDNSAMENHLKALYAAADKEIELGIDNSSTRSRRTPVLVAPRGPASLGYLADSTIACVMPKFRIASVGTTIRNASRNLALIAGRGEMRCCWDMTDTDPLDEDKETLDLLLIPAPYQLHATNFSPASNNVEHIPHLHTDKPNWENFSIDQDWIKTPKKVDRFISECLDLLERARVETRTVNGVILPEYAVTHRVFEELCDKLKEREPELEFVVAGSSTNCKDQSANTVLTRVWQKRDKSKHLTSSRRKHHRWKLDRRQVEMYGLGTVLNPKVANWWETTSVGQRELHFHRFRKDSVFSALICEELARSDVCHDILRAIGPNLVFALLMDSAQLPSRWPGQYATALADDPGCAVLSFTSFALVERSNRLRRDGSRSIALWKDDSGRQVTIDMPQGEGARGILLSLWSEHVKDQTIFGKRSVLRAWRYSSHVAVSVNGPKE